VTAEEIPAGWEVPTLSFLREEPLIFGLPRQQGGIAIGIGFGAFLAASKTVGLLLAVPLTLIVVSVLLAVARWQHGRDPHWWAHATSHHYPAARYTGN
jgi:hypothetical protein